MILSDRVPFNQLVYATQLRYTTGLRNRGCVAWTWLWIAHWQLIGIGSVLHTYLFVISLKINESEWCSTVTSVCTRNLPKTFDLKVWMGLTSVSTKRLYVDDRSQFEVNTDERTRVHSAQSSSEVHPSKYSSRSTCLNFNERVIERYISLVATMNPYLI